MRCWEHSKRAPKDEIVTRFLHSCCDTYLLGATQGRTHAVTRSLTQVLKPITFDKHNAGEWVVIQYKSNKWILVGCNACDGYEECQLEDLEGRSARILTEHSDAFIDFLTDALGFGLSVRYA